MYARSRGRYICLWRGRQCRSLSIKSLRLIFFSSVLFGYLYLYSFGLAFMTAWWRWSRLSWKWKPKTMNPSQISRPNHTCGKWPDMTRYQVNAMPHRVVYLSSNMFNRCLQMANSRLIVSIQGLCCFNIVCIVLAVVIVSPVKLSIFLTYSNVHQYRKDLNTFLQRVLPYCI